MKSSGVVAQQGRGFVAPRFSVGVQRFARLVAAPYMRYAQGVRSIRVIGMEELYQAMLRFQQGETRLVLLFRHVAVADGPLVVSIVARELRRWCRTHRKRLPEIPHVHFLYGKDVLNWAGGLARWAFPRMGGIPVVNGRIDRESQETIRRVVTTGRFPLAFAPEAQVTYHQFASFPSAGGAATIPAWAHDHVRARTHAEGGAPEQRTAAGEAPPRVEILPLAIGYSYGSRSADILRTVCARLHGCLDAAGTDAPDPTATPEQWSARLRDLTTRLVDALERDTLYARSVASSDTGGQLDESLQVRIARLVERALHRGEQAAGLRGEGSVLQRIFRLRHWIMSSRFREDIDLRSQPPLVRAAADRRAALAAAVRPLERMADILEYIDPDYLPDAEPGASGTTGRDRERDMARLTEYALNLLDVCNRATGGDVNTRYEPGGRTARVIVDPPIDASRVLDEAPSQRAGIRRLGEAIDQRFRDLVARLRVA